jgi:hypothetical protein
MYVAPDERVEMRHPERRIECQVLYCERHTDGGYRLGLVMAGDGERRSAHRVAVDLRGKLRIVGTAINTAVRVIDVSQFGLGFEISTRIPVGAFVRIELSSGIFTGEVRHCAKGLDQYRAGMRIQEFVRHTRSRTIAVDDAKSETCGPMAELSRLVDERQARYEAILFSLVPAGDEKCPSQNSNDDKISC